MIMPDPTNDNVYIAEYTGETGMGEFVKEEEAHNIIGSSSEEIILNAAIVWGVDLDNCDVINHIDS